MLAIFLDQETTGLDATKHHVIEIAFKVFDLSLWQLKEEYQQVIRQPKEVWEARDPGSIEVNGFRWDLLTKGEDPNKVGEEIITLFTQLDIQRGKAVFICQNPSFDRAFFAQLVDVYTHEKLRWPYHWLDLASMYWIVRLQEAQRKEKGLPEKILLSKDEIAKFYHLASEERPHRAMNGVNHLILCYQAVLADFRF